MGLQLSWQPQSLEPQAESVNNIDVISKWEGNTVNENIEDIICVHEGQQGAEYTALHYATSYRPWVQGENIYLQSLVFG